MAIVVAMVQQNRGSGSEGAVNVPVGPTRVDQWRDTIDALNCLTVIDKHNNNVATELMEKMLDDHKMSVIRGKTTYPPTRVGG